MPRCPDAQKPRRPDRYLGVKALIAQVPRYPITQIPRCPGTRHPDAQTPRRPDAQAPSCPGAQAPTRLPGAQAPRRPGAQAPRRPGAQVTRWPGAQAPWAPWRPENHMPSQPGILEGNWLPRWPGAQAPSPQAQALRCPDAQTSRCPDRWPGVQVSSGHQGAQEPGFPIQAPSMHLRNQGIRAPRCQDAKGAQATRCPDNQPGTTSHKGKGGKTHQEFFIWVMHIRRHFSDIVCGFQAEKGLYFLGQRFQSKRHEPIAYPVDYLNPSSSHLIDSETFLVKKNENFAKGKNGTPSQP